MTSLNPTSEAQTEPCPACGSILDVTGAQIFAERTCPVCGTQINVRRTFGHYELMGMLGHGGQGMVYRAVDNTLNRLVALKLLHTEYTTDPEFVRQFEAEARVTASINHPNVVRVFSFGSGEGHVYLAMELVDNGTFDELMEKLGRVPEARALQVGIEIAQGLKAGYEQGLIHRDVKPGNILFGRDGTAKIVDFGLAMFFEQSAQQTGEIWGTPYYLSPERLHRVQEDFRSDIYSLGAALFHAIAGRPPFEAEDASQVALKHLRTQAASIQAFAPDVSNATAYVINRTLAKSPDERPQSYDEFIEQLQFAREEALARARGEVPQQRERVVLDDMGSARARNWTGLVTLLILVAVFAIGGVVIWRATRGNDDGQGAGAEAGKLESFGPGWNDARTLLMGGNYSTAAMEFERLAGKHAAGSTERSWAIVHSALAMVLDGNSAGAGRKLGELAGGGTQVSKFFHERVRPRLIEDGPVPASAAEDFSRSNHEAIGTLFFAAKDYMLGSVEPARMLVGQFIATTPEPSVAWIESYSSIAKTFQSDLDAGGPALEAWAKAKTPRARTDALNSLQQAVGKLPSSSKLRPRIQEILDSQGTAARPRPPEPPRPAPAADAAPTRVAGTNFFTAPIGAVGLRGSTVFSNQRFTVTGSGADIWAAADSFQFAWQPMKGDCDVVACLQSINGQDGWSKGVAMIRGSLNRDASHGMMAVTVSGRLQFVTRRAPAGVSVSKNTAATPPRWLKVSRRGAVLTGYASEDGKNWTPAGEETLTGLEETVYVGIGVCSHMNSTLATAEFSDVSITKANP